MLSTRKTNFLNKPNGGKNQTLFETLFHIRFENKETSLTSYTCVCTLFVEFQQCDRFRIVMKFVKCYNWRVTP